ncbi:MAG: ATP-binding protein [Thermoguttaceae bacterium]|nr:ATP-binding protein [Thermoguttaceae bacterium]
MTELIRKFTYQGKEFLSLPAERTAFATLKSWLSDIAVELKIPAKAEKQLLIAADEIFSNIAGYGYPNGDGCVKASVEFNRGEQLLTMVFSDSGIAFNPLLSEEPDTSSPLAERPVGGLGIFLVKKLMDSVEYRRENNRNYLILKKRLSCGNIQ